MPCDSLTRSETHAIAPTRPSRASCSHSALPSPRRATAYLGVAASTRRRRRFQLEISCRVGRELSGRGIVGQGEAARTPRRDSATSGRPGHTHRRRAQAGVLLEEGVDGEGAEVGVLVVDVGARRKRVKEHEGTHRLPVKLQLVGQAAQARLYVTRPQHLHQRHITNKQMNTSEEVNGE
eukprot:65842-Prorocentrum_minimum.AAC.1